MTRNSDSKKAVNYVIKAENSLRIAKISVQQDAYDSAVMNAVHSAINALDALTSLHLNKRSSGSHSEVLSLIKGIFDSREYNDVDRQFKTLLNLKNASEIPARDDEPERGPSLCNVCGTDPCQGQGQLAT